MRTKKTEIIIHIIVSIILCSYIFVRISFNAGLGSYFIIALLNTILLFFHIISLWTIKFNIIREISYIIILPELLAIEVLYEKQTFFALIEAVAVLLLIVTNVILLMKNNKNNTLDFEKKVKKIARDVTLSKISVKLDPMDAYTRRQVHTALQGFKYITTESEGEEPNRCIVVKYCENKKDKDETEE